MTTTLWALGVLEIFGIVLGWFWLRDGDRHNRHGLLVVVVVFAILFAVVGMIYWAVRWFCRGIDLLCDLLDAIVLPDRNNNPPRG